jgi:prophage regulatory protein
MSTNELELQRMKSVCADTGFSRPYVYKLERANNFPKRIKIGRGTFYLKHEVQAYIKARVAERDAKSAGNGK